MPVGRFQDLQDLLYSLARELKTSEEVIMKMPFHIVKRRSEQIEEYRKRQKEEVEAIKTKSKANKGATR